jgi:trans-2,3-dihydro-3-hydroxyanthranilate isomerase
MRRKFHTLDVFTEAPLAGNPLAVVLDSDGLDAARMQAIAREFNLSETVFVLEPRNPINSARIRIFTPARELPFAGHPTIGAAILIADLRAHEIVTRQDLRIVLEEEVGEVVCVARRRPNRAPAAYFTLPRLPAPAGDAPTVEAIAQSVGLEPSEIGFEAHRPAVYSAGTPFLFAPVASRAALAKARPSGAGEATYLYTRETELKDSAYRARMFAGGFGISEDPATGSAAAAFAGVLMQFDPPPEGETTLVIEQGFEMGRPSLIALGMEVENAVLTSATIGGSAVMVSQGWIDV